MTRGRKKKIILEICSDRKNQWFINFTPHQSFGESLGPFNSLDDKPKKEENNNVTPIERGKK